MRRIAALLLMLGGCALTPIYAGGERGAAAAALGQIAVAPIADRSGYLLREELVRRFGASGAPRYRLEIVLDDAISGFGIRSDSSVSRERRTLRARYKLIDTATNAVVLDAAAASDAGIDVVQSEYAVVAAETSALERLTVVLADQITTRVALYARGAAATR